MFGGNILESLGEMMFVMSHIGLRQIHAASEENDVKAKMSYPFARRF